MARPSLKANVKPDAGEAAKVARQIAAPGISPGSGEAEYQGEMETVSYNLPVELIELYRDLAEERFKLDRAEKRKARRNNEKPPQARRSASALVREALEAYRATVEAELAQMRGGKP